MKEEYQKLISLIKDKTGFASEPMKIQSSEEILKEIFENQIDLVFEILSKEGYDTGLNNKK